MAPSPENVPQGARPFAVAVVGAGPAGLAAATSAAERGFAVTLFERADQVGGQFRLAMAVPGKEDFAETLRYFTRRLDVLGVDVRLATEPTEAEHIAELLVDDAGAPVSAAAFAHLACFTVATTTEFLYF